MKTTIEAHPPGAPDLYEMAKSHFNEPIIVGFDLGRVIGYGETDTTQDNDCYLIVAYRNGKITWCTCVGGYTFLDRLRGQGYVRSTTGEDWDDLFRLDSILELNGAPKVVEFRYEVEIDD